MTYILSAKRTPIGSLQGSLSTVTAPKLGAHVIKACIEETGISNSDIDLVIMGNVVQAGVGQAPARQAAIFSGIPDKVPALTVNKVCGSGLAAIINAAQAIKCSDANLVVAGGMENMSLAPFYIPEMRSGKKFGETKILDAMENDGLKDAYSGAAMGLFAEDCVSKYHFKREELDQFSIESFKRAQMANNDGTFASEIAPIQIQQKNSNIIVGKDEGPFKANFDKIPGLKSAFKKDGAITAANASTINDGAAALILGGEQFKSMAKFKIVAYAGHANSPDWFTTAPISAISNCLKKAKMRMEDIDLFEINEAFAVVCLAAMKELKIEHRKLNIFGGAISLGHPIGCSGARIVTTLMNGMLKQDKKYGLAAICIGGGEALSLIIEKIK